MHAERPFYQVEAVYRGTPHADLCADCGEPIGPCHCSAGYDHTTGYRCAECTDGPVEKRGE